MSNLLALNYEDLVEPLISLNVAEDGSVSYFLSYISSQRSLTDSARPR